MQDAYGADWGIIMRRITSPNSRPHTPSRPTLASLGSRSNSDIKSTKSGTKSAPKSYGNLVSQTAADLDAYNEDNEVDEELAYDDDEDEFGLPSVASMRKSKSQAIRRNQTSIARVNDPFESHTNGSSTLMSEIGNMRLRANSSDIAEERGSLAYPNTKVSKGKILRPQYKELLNGKRTLISDISSPTRTPNK